jgi:hypothetical protein
MEGQLANGEWAWLRNMPMQEGVDSPLALAPNYVMFYDSTAQNPQY